VTTLQHATTDLVATAWLATIPGITADMTGTRLPRPASDGTVSWADSGFYQVTSGIGGTPGMYVPLSSVVVQIDCWATQSNSDLPPLAKANALAMAVWWAAVENTGIETVLNLRAGYAGARVMSAYLLGEPRPMYNDPSDYARYMVAVAMNWVEVA
jgi:hypothetical protein